MYVKNKVGRHGLHSFGADYGPVAGVCEHSNELLFPKIMMFFIII